MINKPTTEQNSKYSDLEKKSIHELLVGMNSEDKTVPLAIEKEIPQIEKLVEAASTKLKQGGRLFYLGAGTSGRLGIVDASECPPTFGVDDNLVIGLIAGGDKAIRKAVEFAEDDEMGGWNDLLEHDVNKNDFVIGIAASGRTPYVIGAMKNCKENEIQTGCITCNKDSELAKNCDFPIQVVVGPEFVTGSTRMKAGTAQKLVLNMISSSCMIQMGRVKGNKMVDMQLSNHKLVKRGTQMVMEATQLDHDSALALLEKMGSVRLAVEEFENQKD